MFSELGTAEPIALREGHLAGAAGLDRGTQQPLANGKGTEIHTP